MTTKRVMLLIAVVVLLTVPVGAAQPEQVGEFVPIDELPEEDRLPAAPFLIAAYSVIWLLAFGYFWRLSQRLGSVEQDIRDLQRRPDPGGGEGAD